MYMKICVVGDVLDVITYAKFQNEIFRGYNFTGGRIFHFSYWFWMGLTTVQRYCAACDTCLWQTDTWQQHNTALAWRRTVNTMCPNFTKFSMHVTRGRGSSLLWLYVFLVFWMTSRIYIMGPSGQNKRQRYVWSSSPYGGTWKVVDYHSSFVVPDDTHFVGCEVICSSNFIHERLCLRRHTVPVLNYLLVLVITGHSVTFNWMSAADIGAHDTLSIRLTATLSHCEMSVTAYEERPKSIMTYQAALAICNKFVSFLFSGA